MTPVPVVPDGRVIVTGPVQAGHFECVDARAMRG